MKQFNEFAIVINQYDIELPISIEARYILSAYRSYHRFETHKHRRGHNNRTFSKETLLKFITTNFRISKFSAKKYMEDLLETEVVRETKSGYYVLSKKEIIDAFYPEKRHFFWIEWINEKNSLFSLKNFKELCVRFEAGLPQSKLIEKRDLKYNQNPTINYTTQSRIAKTLGLSEQIVSIYLKGLQKVYGYQPISESEYKIIEYGNKSGFGQYTPIFKFTGTKMFDPESGEEFTQVRHYKYIGVSLRTSLNYMSVVKGRTKEQKNNKMVHVCNYLVNSDKYDCVLKSSETGEYVVSYSHEETIPNIGDDLKDGENRFTPSLDHRLNIVAVSFHIAFLKLELYSRRIMLLESLNLLSFLKKSNGFSIFNKVMKTKNAILARIKIIRSRIYRLEGVELQNAERILISFAKTKDRLNDIELIIKDKLHSKAYKLFKDRSATLQDTIDTSDSEQKIKQMISDSIYGLGLEAKGSSH